MASSEPSPSAESSSPKTDALGRRLRTTDRLLGDDWAQPATILGNFADATGHSSAFPTGPRASAVQVLPAYRTQEELLSVARDYHSRGLPLDVIVADYYHWTRLGDWRLTRTTGPDVEAMTEELKQLGARLMVSVWPSLSPLSTNYQPMRDAGTSSGRSRVCLPIISSLTRASTGSRSVSASTMPRAPTRASTCGTRREGHYFEHGRQALVVGRLRA